METAQRPSALENLLKMFGLSNTPTLTAAGDDVASDVDEPPDHVPELAWDHKQEPAYVKHTAPSACVRRESLLTRAILDHNKPLDSAMSTSSRATSSRTMSTASSQSLTSTAELTSDGDLTSPTRSASPSSPLLLAQFHRLESKGPDGAKKISFAPVVKEDLPTPLEGGEAAIEKSLGRKRCIMFACADQSPEPVKVPVATAAPRVEPEPRRCRLTFVCPTRQDSDRVAVTPATTLATRGRTAVQMPPAIDTQPQPVPTAKITSPTFHEFGTSHEETDAWVDEPMPQGPKLTLADCNKKENDIRRIAEEVEEEVQAEQMDEQDLDESEGEDDGAADDFAPSDDESDGGNESDDEGGFADSDDESNDGSEYQFWAPVTTTATITADSLTHFSSRRSRSSSLGSAQSGSASSVERTPGRRRRSKAIKMRPGTPELPDSTDFVCGTLDEDRPLEAAFIALREQRKREKHITIPQDIDPSFPTSDPEDDPDDDEADDVLESQRIVEQLVMSEESGGLHPSTVKVSPVPTPLSIRPDLVRPLGPARRSTNRSPPPPRHRAPAPRRLFSQSPTELRSPPPAGRYRSPQGSPIHLKMPLGITINRLAQRPNTSRPASLPHTPNPFFRNWERGSPPISRIPSAAVTPGTETDEVRSDLHVRGPVDIVIGLEKKRQKRKEKLWRQHCRKAAKEQAERKPVAGRGVERMKELGLECAERTRGYGLGPQAQLVLSL